MTRAGLRGNSCPIEAFDENCPYSPQFQSDYSGFYPFHVRHRYEKSSAARPSHKQENASRGNRTMHSVIHTQFVHLNAGNNNRSPEISVVAVAPQLTGAMNISLRAG